MLTIAVSTHRIVWFITKKKFKCQKTLFSRKKLISWTNKKIVQKTYDRLFIRNTIVVLFLSRHNSNLFNANLIVLLRKKPNRAKLHSHNSFCARWSAHTQINFLRSLDESQSWHCLTNLKQTNWNICGCKWICIDTKLSFPVSMKRYNNNLTCDDGII